MGRLLGAVQFLTILPVGHTAREPSRGAPFFPLTGAVLGAAGAGLLLLMDPYVPLQVRTLIVLAFWIVSTGALHEDGLADTADALRSGRSREQILEIMKDSRIGTYGAVAVTLLLLIRWQALASITANILPSLVAALALSRASMVVLARISRPVTSGTGGEFVRGISTPVALFAIAQAFAAALWCGPVRAAILLLGTAIIIVLMRAWFHRRLGGVTGDCLGATSQLVEAFALIALAS